MPFIYINIIPVIIFHLPHVVFDQFVRNRILPRSNLSFGSFLFLFFFKTTFVKFGCCLFFFYCITPCFTCKLQMRQKLKKNKANKRCAHQCHPIHYNQLIYIFVFQHNAQSIIVYIIWLFQHREAKKKTVFSVSFHEKQNHFKNKHKHTGPDSI